MAANTPDQNQALMDLIRRINENDVDKLAQSKGYVGNIDITPMFSPDINNIRSMRNKLEGMLSNIAVSIDYKLDPNKANKDLTELKKQVATDLKISENALERKMRLHSRLLTKKESPIGLTSVEENLYNKLDKELSSILELTKLINKAQHSTNEELQEEADNLLVQVLIKRNEEQQLIKDINKELSYQNKLQDEGVTLQERFVHNLEKHHLNVSRFSNGFNEIKRGLLGILDTSKKMLEPWSKLDQASANYARQIGIGGRAYRQLREDIITTSRSRYIAQKTGVGAEEQVEAIGQYLTNVGRNIGFSEVQQENIAYGVSQFSPIGKDNAQAFMQALENFGLSADAAINKATELFKTSEKSGIAYSKYSKIFLENIKLAQNYTFSKGLNGLSEMAKRSAEIKMNLSEVSKFVDKTSTLEGSLQSAAGLSVLGGNFAIGANPLNMLYNGLNSFEGAEKQMENMLKGLVKYNSETKQLEMSAFNRERMKAAAQAMGVDYNTMMESAFAIGREERVAPLINGLGIRKGSDEYQTILNKSYLDKEGNAKVNVRGQAKNISELTKQDIEEISRSNFNDSDNIKTITETLLGWDDVLLGTKKGIEEEKAYLAEVSGIGEGAKSLIKIGQDHSHLLGDIITAIDAFKVAVLIAMSANGVFNMGSAVRGGRGIPNINSGLGGSSTNLAPNMRTFSGVRQQYENALGAGLSKRQAAWYARDEAMKSGMSRKAANWAVRNAAFRNSGLGKALTWTPKTTIGGIGAGLAGLGIGMGGNLLGGYIQNNATGTLQNGEGGIGQYTAGGAISGAATGAGIGMTIGSIIPGLGTLAGGLIGGAIGGLIGGVSSHSDAKKMNLKAQIERRIGRRLNGDYNTNELEAINRGAEAINNFGGNLGMKIREYEGISSDNFSIFNGVTMHKDGGIIKPKKMTNGGVLTGKGTGTSDSNLAWLSNNEYIMPAKQTVKPNNRKILDTMRRGENLVPVFKDGGIIKPIGNQMNIMKVNDYGNSYSSNNSQSNKSNISVQSVKIEPLTINGTIKLDLGGRTKDIDGKELLNNPMFIKNITDMIAKNLNRQTHYGYEKNEFYKKF